jgi:hypothetical protein
MEPYVSSIMMVLLAGVLFSASAAATTPSFFTAKVFFVR